MRALVTGASGFVGHYLVRHLTECGDTVLATIFPGSTLDPSLKVESEPLDLADLSRTTGVISSFRPDVIYHLAGIAFVPEAENDFQKALTANVLCTSNVFRSAHLLQSGMTVALISSAEVYGKIMAADLPINESVAIRPANNYSLSKAMAELVAERYARQGQLKALILRPFNHLGAGQAPQFVASNFAQQLARIACGKVAPVLQVGNLDVKRDFSDVRDIVRAYRLSAVKGQGTYNLGAGHSTSIQTILDTLISISGIKVEVTQDPARMRPAEVHEIFGDISRAKRELGWSPTISLRETLESVYRYWLERES